MIHQFLQRLEANRVLMKNKIILSIVTIIVVAIFAFIYWLKPEDNLNANIQNNSNNSSVKQTNQNINSPNSSSIQPVNQLSVAPISTANGQKEFQMPNTNWQDRELLINGKIGYNDARFKAIHYTLLYLGYRKAFDLIIDKSWDLNIPRYLTE